MAAPMAAPMAAAPMGQPMAAPMGAPMGGMMPTPQMAMQIRQQWLGGTWTVPDDGIRSMQC